MREALPDLDHPLGLLMPQQMPELPCIAMQLIPGLVTNMDVQPQGVTRVSRKDLEAAQAW